ncbi:MAG: hypothetical protein ACP5KJ_00060 [Candidatus Micrarchaeia archaeon]
MITKSEERKVQSLPISFRKHFPVISKSEISLEEFENLFSSLKQKCSLDNSLNERSMLLLATVGGRFFRSGANLILRKDNSFVKILLGHALLTRLWIKELALITNIGNEKEKFAEYIYNGGNIGYKEIVEPYCCFNFFPNPKLAIDHNKFFKSFLDSIPSDQTIFIGKKATADRYFEISRQIQTLKRLAPYHYQKYAVGMPQENFRFICKIDNLLAAKRILFWEPSIIEKIEIMRKQDLPVQTIEEMVDVEDVPVAIMKDEGKKLGRFIEENATNTEQIEKALSALGALLRIMHENGTGHDKPEEIQIKDDGTPVISSHEDVWIKGEPLSDEEKKQGIEMVFDVMKKMSLEFQEKLKKIIMDAYEKTKMGS